MIADNEIRSTNRFSLKRATFCKVLQSFFVAKHTGTSKLPGVCDLHTEEQESSPRTVPGGNVLFKKVYGDNFEISSARAS